MHDLQQDPRPRLYERANGCLQTRTGRPLSITFCLGLLLACPPLYTLCMFCGRTPGFGFMSGQMAYRKLAGSYQCLLPSPLVPGTHPTFPVPYMGYETLLLYTLLRLRTSQPAAACESTVTLIPGCRSRVSQKSLWHRLTHYSSGGFQINYCSMHNSPARLVEPATDHRVHQKRFTQVPGRITVLLFPPLLRPSCWLFASCLNSAGGVLP